MEKDQYFMKLALEMSASAKGKTNPNPIVGAVIVKDGVIVGSGIHRKAGEPHAEVHAFKMAGSHAEGATLYVTLEPCSHYGKTPPCANLVKDSKVSRVVVATTDPNPEVAGRGIQLLRNAGIEVEVGVLEEEAKKLNERFIHNMTTGLPFVISKFAMTLDGKIATHNGHSKWITSESARKEVHQLRNEIDGILVGVGTVIADNPALTTRLPETQGKNPTRIILDTNLRTPIDSQVLQTVAAKTIIVTSDEVDMERAKPFEAKGVKIIFVSKETNGLDLYAALRELYRLGITDILVEGGGAVNASFLNAGLIDKYYIYIAPKVLGGKDSITPFTGPNPDTMIAAKHLYFDDFQKLGEDIRIIAYPKQGDEK
ncbi:bifunctional diaminohydroxyphosphoribosylaminopyrimidine deaminase/5-amino-6-(5-phosphoribosylamino)uracil reductase RibD [Psychrobacillus sp. Sa2BUA9]|uniref:Riboflavin biosynthesis protein RibD n=1 Tax=Psychrobacillus faecigallinarum TaxID=2762235 RepID=A0ABR8R9X3_9BACI|nr:bifunctional diaminohydroxyphosphoribosylaminopyrimidine deaminase/5-amino-6-(5-phosphoribosylamino)uracil reductase RibD [Psychrobacillus faecigallinarum]MBD7944598.1 bifunctional diaminohydroxyphosphoribosylaminopyrimidine deaminase/5-amino-6-(5-phosphoribosylamino)uracil reductase RibD [Psychrobacillus faecigallinarum]